MLPFENDLAATFAPVEPFVLMSNEKPPPAGSDRTQVALSNLTRYVYVVSARRARICSRMPIINSRNSSASSG